MKLKNYKCKCGFKFSKPGEYRNCDSFIDTEGESWVICPKCKAQYKTQRKEGMGKKNKFKNATELVNYYMDKIYQKLYEIYKLRKEHSQ